MTTKRDFSATVCGSCDAVERRFLHRVQYRGTLRRLCTTCVLKLHPQSFCPTCFLVYHPSPPPFTPNDVVTCLNCCSLSHTACVGTNPPRPYTCPLCVTPNSPIFVLHNGKGNNENCKVVDKKAARILLTAATIASTSMSKAAVAARAEAERRAKEAAFTRKRAREALEHVALLVARDNVKRKDVLPVVSKCPRSSGGNVTSVMDRRGDERLSMVVAAVPLEEENNENVDRLGASAEVVVALNAVDLKGQDIMPRLSAVDNSTAMDVDEMVE